MKTIINPKIRKDGKVMVTTIFSNARQIRSLMTLEQAKKEQAEDTGLRDLPTGFENASWQR